MQNTCPVPGCGAIYNLTPQHVGRRFSCKKCGASLVVQPEGLQLATAPVVAEAEAFEDLQTPRPPRKPLGWRLDLLQPIWDRIRQDIPTFLFGWGAVLIVMYLFFPLIDRAKESRLQAAIDAGENRAREALRPQNPPAEDAKKKAEDWEKKKKDLSKDLDDLRISNRRSIYWYMWGMMLGFLLLAIAALGYLSPSQSVARRIVGSIVICAEVVLIFIAFVIPGAISYHAR